MHLTYKAGAQIIRAGHNVIDTSSFQCLRGSLKVDLRHQRRKVLQDISVSGGAVSICPWHLTHFTDSLGSPRPRTGSVF
jgi:hypothetical protein